MSSAERTVNTKRILRRLVHDLMADDNNFTVRVLIWQLIRVYRPQFIRTILDHETREEILRRS